MIFGDARISGWLFRWPEFAFSHPEYPIGLPLLYAGIAFLLGHWEDHAMALLFPLLQVGTLLALVGWLRRRGATTAVALASSALVANCGLLYSPILTGGMAEVPASFTFLLVGIAFCDVLDRTDEGSLRRLFVASLLAASTKNEGLFLLGTALALLFLRSLWRRESPIWSAAAAIAVPGLMSLLLHRLALGRHPLRDFDFGVLWRPGLGGPVAETLREDLAQLIGRILALAGASLATYLILPAFCVLGPAWLVHWAVGRVSTALAPLVAAGLGAAWGGAARPHP